MAAPIAIDHAQNGSINGAGLNDAEKVAAATMIANDETRGAAVHASSHVTPSGCADVLQTFDPDATPEQKAAAAGKAKGKLFGAPAALGTGVSKLGQGVTKLPGAAVKVPGHALGAVTALPGTVANLPGAVAHLPSAIPGVNRVRQNLEEGEGRAVAVDTSTKDTAPTPTVTIDDVDRTSRAEGQEVGGDSIPGAIPTGAAPPVPTWVTRGWRQAAGLDGAIATDEKAQAEAGMLADYVSESAYGAWFHNAGIILFAVLTTRFITVLHFGWGWIILIIASCASYYSLSISRTRQRARDDIQRELVKTRLVTETESADWLNGFLDRFWLIYEPVLSQTIVASVDSALAGVTPGFCESIRLTTFTPPRIDYVRTFPKTPEDVVIMDWALSFTPNDLLDVTPRQAAGRVNPKIVLSIRLGKGAVSKAIPILLEDMSFTGRMRIKLKLMTNFPHIQTVDISFIEKPTFDYVLKPIGGETFGFDINNIPGLAPFIRDQVHANLGPMMYDPNVFTIDLQALLSGTPLDSAIGVLQIHVRNARGLKAVKLGGGAPDPYVSIALGAKPPVSKTKTIPSSSNPSWQQTQFVLINTLADVLNLSLYDYNDHRPDNLLGTVSQELVTLLDDAEQEGLTGKILAGGKDRGELRYDLSYFPVLQPQKGPDGVIEPLPDTQTGIVRFTIHQAKDLDITREHGDLNPFARVFLGNSKRPVHTTPTLKHANSPIWESHCEFLVPDKHASTVTIQIVDSKDFAHDPTVGRLTVKLTDLLEARERQQDWFPLTKSRAGKIRLSTEWKPVAMTGGMDGAAAYVPPMGVLRIWLKKAIDVKNVEAALGGKSDPYVRVMSNNKILARTEVVNNNLNPEWDQIVYVPVHHLREHVMLEVMDYQNIGKDRSLGHVELRAADCITTGSDPKYPYISTGPQQRSDKIKLDKANTFKGQLVYDVDFKPAVSLRGGVSFEAEKNPLEIAAEQSAEGSGENSIVNAANGDAAPMPVSAATTNGSVQGHRPSVSIGGNSVVSAFSATESRAGGEATASENPEQGVSMTNEELLSNQSGVLVFQVVSGQLARKGALEIMFDDGYWPSFTSTRARSSHPTWDQIGEGFVRELDFSRIWLRINADEDVGDVDCVAEFKCDTKDFLEQCLEQPADFMLSLPDGSNRSTIKMSARFVPVDIVLEPRESINNMGVLRVDVISAKGLMGADRSGKSDPYVVFNLNGHKVFKSETKKKTLAPVWNESFEVMVPSRVAANFAFEIFDWDRVGTATHLGDGVVDLAALEPFEATEVHLPVVHQKGGEKGSISLRMLFQPEIIARSRQKTSTFSTAGRVVTTIGGVPLAAGKGVIQGGGAVAMGVGHGIGTVGSGIGHGIGSVGGFAGRRIGLIKKKDKSGKEVLVPADADEGFDVPAGQVSQPVMDGEAQATTIPPGIPVAPPSEPGTLAVTVLGGKDIKSKEGSGVKSYVVLKLAGKDKKTGHVKGVEPEWNESFSWTVQPGTSSFSLTVFEHHTLGKDIELGEAEVDIWRHIQPAVPNADVQVELKSGSGLIKLRLDWDGGNGAANLAKGPVSPKLGRVASISSKNGNTASPSRFSLGPLTPKKKDKEKE